MFMNNATSYLIQQQFDCHSSVFHSKNQFKRYLKRRGALSNIVKAEKLEEEGGKQ